MEQKYCIRCGKVNDNKRKRCKKCFRKLEPKEHLLIDYFIGKGWGEAEETFSKNFKKLIIHYLYGFVMACSILVTTISVIANMKQSDTSYIEKVTEKPVIIMHKNPSNDNEKFFDVALSYVDSIQNGDLEEANSYLLENNYPDILKEIDYYETEYFGPLENRPRHMILEYGSALFKMTMEGDYHINKNPVKSSERDSKYRYQIYYVHMNYCSFNSCKVENGNEVNDYTIPFSVGVIEVNNKYYVFREALVIPKYKDNLILDMMIANNGDISLINFDGVEERYGSCIGNHTDEYCLKAAAH